jgi:ferric-dicitrate binding protein FerR (iron transport regulator)
MKDYRSLTVEELATDAFFRSWVIEPTPENSSFWISWVGSNTDKSAEIGLARDLVLAVHEIYSDALPQETLDDEIREISRLAELSKQKKKRNVFQLTNQPLWRVAAIFLFISSIGLWLYNTKDKPVASNTKNAKVAGNETLIVRKNISSREMTVLLSDNSVATLTPGSTIQYPKKFADKARKVILTGEAFFDVARNPEQPFLVFTNETVTKVLGTSFRVKALDDENTVMVMVKTGRVSVYPKTDYEKLEKKPDNGVSVIVLDPNQQAVFNRKENTLEKSNVVNRQLLSELSAQKELIFDDKPVSQVFKTLQEMYGIVIVYDAEIIANCIITTQFSDENLKQRLNAICQAIGASYEMVNGRIVISSKGCS